MDLLVPMPCYRVFRLRENLRQQFRWAPHLSGVTALKPKDYEEDLTLDATSPYAAWHELKGSDRELNVGDVLACGELDVRILKYIGFEEARWIVPEQRQVAVLPIPENPQASPALG